MIRVLNSLDPDQALHFVRPALGLELLQRFSVDDTGMLRAEYLFNCCSFFNPLTATFLSFAFYICCMYTQRQ